MLKRLISASLHFLVELFLSNDNTRSIVEECPRGGVPVEEVVRFVCHDNALWWRWEVGETLEASVITTGFHCHMRCELHSVADSIVSGRYVPLVSSINYPAPLHGRAPQSRVRNSARQGQYFILLNYAFCSCIVTALRFAICNTIQISTD